MAQANNYSNDNKNTYTPHNNVLGFNTIKCLYHRY